MGEPVVSVVQQASSAGEPNGQTGVEPKDRSVMEPKDGSAVEPTDEEGGVGRAGTGMRATERGVGDVRRQGGVR